MIKICKSSDNPLVNTVTPQLRVLAFKIIAPNKSYLFAISENLYFLMCYVYLCNKLFYVEWQKNEKYSKETWDLAFFVP